MTFPLHAATYRIEKRVYRRNPYKHGASYKMYCDVGDTPDLYPEEEDAEDGPSCAYVSYGENLCKDEKHGAIVTAKEIATERDAAIGNIEVVEKSQETCDNPCISFVDGRWIAKIYVPTSLIGLLIGVRGRTARQLEDSTGCRVEIPRKDPDSPVVVRAKDLGNVQRCVEQINAIVEQGKANTRFTHFTAFPCNNPDIIENFVAFRDGILCSNTVSESIKDESLFVHPNRLHLTITMLWILDANDTAKAKLTLDAASQEIRSKLGEGKIVADIMGISIMNDDPFNVDVLYANVSGDLLQEAANIVYKLMVEAGLSQKVETGVSTTAHPVKLHMTLINSRKKAQKTGMKRVTFDATDVLKEYKDYYFGTIIMDKISICKLSGGAENSYYEELSCIQL